MLGDIKTVDKLTALPSLGKGHLGDLKIELAGVRVWLSETEYGFITVERVVGGYWEFVPDEAVETVLQISMNILGLL